MCCRNNHSYKRRYDSTIITFAYQTKITLLIALAPGLTSCLQGSVNDHRGALLLVPQ